MSRRQFVITLVVVTVAGLLGGLLSDRSRGTPVAAQPQPAAGAAPDAVLGIVADGAFHRVSPRPDFARATRLTAVKMQEAIAPEAGELDLTNYEGRATMVAGRDGGGWIYSAAIVDQAGPIVTALVRQVFGEDG